MQKVYHPKAKNKQLENYHTNRSLKMCACMPIFCETNWNLYVDVDESSRKCTLTIFLPSSEEYTLQ